jgi:hypothetical protein
MLDSNVLIVIFIILIAAAVAADMLFLRVQFKKLRECMRLIAKGLQREERGK